MQNHLPRTHSLFFLGTNLQIWQGGGDGSDVAKIENIAVQCEKTFIKVEVKFDRPFAGMIYSKGHYSDQGRKRRSQIERFSRFTNAVETGYRVTSL